MRPSDSTFNQRGGQYLAFYPPRFRQACSSHHQIVICICFWFKLKQNINKYLLLAEDPQEVLEPAYTRKDLIRTPHAHGSSGRLDPSLKKYWDGNAMAGRSAGEVWMRVGLVCFYCSSCTCIWVIFPRAGKMSKMCPFFLFFEASLWQNGLIFLSFLNCSEEIMSVAV